MNTVKDALTLTNDPVYPWSISGIGLPGLLLVAALLTLVTIWTYKGVQGASRRRVLFVLSLRLLALLLAILALLRPSFAYRNELHVPSLLIISLDRSLSMGIQDETGGQSRWDRLQDVLKKCEPTLQKLREDHNIQVVFNGFAGDVTDYDPTQPPDGKRTDFGNLLNTLLERYRGEKYLRGHIILSDGADNGTRFQPMVLAAQWRSLPCPLFTFGLGKTTTTDKQSDIAVVAVNPEPSPVPIKGELTVRVTLDAPGFLNKNFRPHLKIEGKEVSTRIFMDDKEIVGRNPVFSLTNGNELIMKCTAPDTPGEVKLEVSVDKQDGETNEANNSMSTYLTVTKEGISVLLVEALGRHPEPQRLYNTLAKNPRIRMFVAWFGTGDVVDPAQTDLLNFDKQRYDVIILGDITPAQLALGDRKVFATIKELVEKGTGLLMIGGQHSYGNSDWKNTPLGEILPVDMSGAGQVEGGARGIKMVPIATKLDQYVLRLADKKEDNVKLWDKLHPLSRITNLGQPRTGATTLAESPDHKPILVWWQPPNAQGRVMAFAGDSTALWIRDDETLVAYTRFWDQMAIWLARQDETESNIKVKLKTRRIAAGDPLDFVGLTLVDQSGKDVKDARFKVTVTDPKGNVSKVPTARDKDGDKGTIWKTEAVGEYQMEITGEGKGADGKDITGSLSRPMRFLVYQDDAEMAQRAANHGFLKKLAEAGGGEFHRIEELAAFLQKLQSENLPQSHPKANLWPDWKRSKLTPFLPAYFVLFVALLSLEWFCRRRWGMV